MSSSFRRPYTEVGTILYVLIGMLSTTSTILLLRSFRSSVWRRERQKMSKGLLVPWVHSIPDHA